MPLINFKEKCVLTISAHADDMELGCGATIARILEEGGKVHSLILSLRINACPPDFTKIELRDEVRLAHAEIGIDEENITILDYENRIFSSRRQDILDVFVKVANDMRPDLVFVASLNDIHQDHHVLAEEALRAFKHSTVWSYELPWNQRSQQFDIFCAVSQRHLDLKNSALQQYKSQLISRPYYFDSEFFRSLAIVRGTQVRIQYAEAFELIRMVQY